jgi:hypothetical protein
LAATTIATDAAAVDFVATLALPAVTMAGVFAALGSGYAAAVMWPEMASSQSSPLAKSGSPVT